MPANKGIYIFCLRTDISEKRIPNEKRSNPRFDSYPNLLKIIVQGLVAAINPPNKLIFFLNPNSKRRKKIAIGKRDPAKTDGSLIANTESPKSFIAGTIRYV